MESEIEHEKSHRVPRDGHFVCELCGETFIQFNQLVLHDTASNCYKCMMCNIKCENEIGLKKHIINEHGINNDSEPEYDTSDMKIKVDEYNNE